MTVKACKFERITRSLRRVRAEPTSRQARQDIALASLGFGTLGSLEDDVAVAADCGTSALRAEEFRQKRAHMARAAACMEAVFSLPDLEPMLGPSTIKVPGLTPDIVKMVLAGQHKAGCWDPWVPHQTLFEHRHAEPSPPFHANIVETFHSADPGWVYLCFRNSGKSTLSEEGFILRALLRLFGNALVLGFNQQRAVERLEAIKHELETNERINAIFGDARGQVWQGQKVTLSNGVCLQAVGSGQSLRGIKHYDFRPDCLLLDDVEGDIVAAMRMIEREASEGRTVPKNHFFVSSLSSGVDAPPLDAECLPITLGKMPTWKTMVVPVRSISLGENSFFETWLAGHSIDAADTALTDMPHVIEEQRPAKSFDLVHEAMADSPPSINQVSGMEKPELEEEAPGIKEAARRANVERQPYRERKKAMAEAEAKSDEPAPSPVVEPEAQRELTEIERAMA